MAAAPSQQDSQALATRSGGTALLKTGSDTIGSVLEGWARLQPDKAFLVFENDAGSTQEITYGEAYRRACGVARALRDLGVAHGDRINVHLTNCPEFIDVLFGAALIGAVIVPTNPLSTADELSFVVSHSGCRLSITQPDLADTVIAVRNSLGDGVILLARADGDVDGASTLARAIAAAGDESIAAPRVGTDIVSVMYTSGTTSRPKGVLVSNAAYLHVGLVVAEHLRLRPADRHLVVLPLFHGNAQFYSLMSALVTGASVALMSRFSASRWARQAARHECTVASLFAAPMRMILAQPADEADARNDLDTVVFAQNVSQEQLVEFERRFGVRLLQLYGMTETVSPPLMNPLLGERRNMGVGRPLLWTQVRVVDARGDDVSQGETGQLLVGGHPGTVLMSGYLHDTEATEAALGAGWLKTGDNVRVDEDGYFYFVDRGKDMIKRAGENVATSEVERVINEHPDVFDSAAIGVPDAMRDETIKVYVVVRAGATCTEQDIIAWCSSRLSRFKVPEFVEFVGELPRTSVGKIQKHVLREWHAAGT